MTKTQKTDRNDAHATDVYRQNRDMAERLLDVEEMDEVQISFIHNGEEKTTRQAVVKIAERGMETEVYMEECEGWNGPSLSLVVSTTFVAELKTTMNRPTDDPLKVQEFTEMTVNAPEVHE